MPGLQMFKKGFYSHIGANQPIVAGTINLGSTKGRGSTTRMFNYCNERSPNPAGCINQFTNITPSLTSTQITIPTPITIPTLIPTPITIPTSTPTPTPITIPTLTPITIPTLTPTPSPTSTPFTILVYSLSQGSNVFWSGVFFTLDTSLPNYSYKATTTSIPGTRVPNSSRLIGVTIGNTVQTIGNNAFSYCKSLTSVTISNSVQTISNGVFAFSSSFTSILIPDSVTTIGSDAFQYCDNLTTVTISSATATNLGITSPTTNPPGVAFFGVTVATILPAP